MKELIEMNAEEKTYPDPPTPPKCRTIEEGKEEALIMNKLGNTLKRGWNILNSYLVFILIAVAIGVLIGVSVSKKFYSEKIKESIAVGGMLVEKEVYTISKK